MAEEKKTSPGIPSLIDGLDFGVLLVDRDLKVLWLNSAMERLFGITRASVQGQDIFSFFNSYIVPRIVDGEPIREQIFASLASVSPVQNTEFRLSSPTGQPVWVEYSSQVIEHGPFKGMRLDIFQDITLRVLLQREIDRHVGDLGTLIEGRTAELSRVNEQLRQETGERKKIEEQLSREQEFGGHLLETLPVYLLSLDREGNVFIAGNALLRILGMEKEQLLGKPFFSEVVVPKEREHAFRRFRRSIESRTEGRDEVRMQTKDGSIITVDWRYRPVYQDDGSVTYVLAVGTDISEQKAMLETLRTSEDLYRTIFENTLAATAILNEDLSIFRANVELENITGFPREALAGKRLAELLAPEERKKLSQQITVPRESCECRLIRSDGQLRQALISLASIPGGKRYVASFLDITDRKQAEQQLADRNHTLSVINQMITAATSSQNLENNLTILLEKALQLLGLDAGAVYLVETNGKSARLASQHGIPEWMMKEAHYLNILDPPYRAIFLEGKSEFREKKEIGLFSFAWIPFFADSRVIGAASFMTGRREAFPESERVILESLSREVGNAIHCGLLKEELAESNTLSNLYLDIMIHDINNANAVSLMYADLLAEMLDGERKEMAEKLTAGIRRSTGIITNVSTMRKIREEKAALQPVSLDETISREMMGFPGAHISYSPSGLTVCADPLLSEVFANLIGNSLKFGGKSVNIWISVSDLGDMAEVAVADDGPGIPDSVKPLLFRRFERGQTKVRGKGLGLYLCRMLVERYDGKIWMEDRVPGHPEQGIVFKFQLKKEPCGD
ncbi:MAG: PAS domain S-box protein [Methanomicrobiales archaeon]|nr:PAS domain S-box protein [Methanomicrobiales archaeon]